MWTVWKISTSLKNPKMCKEDSIAHTLVFLILSNLVHCQLTDLPTQSPSDHLLPPSDPPAPPSDHLLPPSDPPAPPSDPPAPPSDPPAPPSESPPPPSDPPPPQSDPPSSHPTPSCSDHLSSSTDPPPSASDPPSSDPPPLDPPPSDPPPHFDHMPPSTDLPPSLDYLNFSIIPDPMIQTYTEEYNAMCPHTRMCNVLIDYNSTLLLVEDIKRFPCCGSCLQNCHNDCLKTLDCCIDALPRLLTTDEVRNVHEKPTKCVLPQYRPIHKSRVNNNEAYLMMTRCSPSYEDKTVRDKCLKEYSDFDFEKDIPSFLPVTDNTTKISYKNKYCAMCNWASSSNLVFWKVVLGSTGQVFETNQFQSMSDITLLFTQDSTSNALFKVPDSLKEDESSVVYCDFYIDECNVTGLWKEYNADIEALCLSYLSKYEDYKNVHCYLCNSLEDPYIPELCEESLISPPPSSFIALLDFNNLEKPEGENPEQEIQCTDDHMYDPWTAKCRKLTCADSMMLTGDRCRPFLEEMSEGSFAVTFRLVPSKGFIDVRIIQTIELLLYEDISSLLNTLAMDLHLQPIQIFLKLTDTLKSRQGTLKWRTTSSYKEAIKYVAIRVIVSFQLYELKNSKLLIEELSDKLYSVDFAITGGLTTEFADINFEQYEFKLHEEMTEHPPSSDLMTNFSWYPYDCSRFGLITPFTDSQDGLGVLPVSAPLIEHGKHLRLFQFGFCPLVMLSKNEFSVPIERQSVYLTYKNEHINMSEVLFSSNDSSILLCSKDYIYGDGNQSHQSNNKQDSSYNTEVVLSIVCTSVSLLSLLIVFITYCMFKTLRTLPGLNLMALVTSLFLAQLFYLLGGVIEIPWKWLCEALGLLLHFCLVLSFLWMGVCTFHMMKVFALMTSRVTHENVRPRFIKYCVFVSASSVMLVLVNILVSMLEESSLGYGGQPCYITRNNMILFTVAIPLVVIIISNLIMFAYVVIKVCKLPEVQKNTKHQRQNLVIFIKLSTLTGITWVFAFIYQWTSIKAFAYLYIIANASQGLFILFSFVINKRVYSMLNASYQSSYLYKVSHKSRTDTGERSSGEAVHNGASRLQLNHL